MANNAICKNKNAALLILETITETIKSDTQRAALKAVAEWIRENTSFTDIPDSYEERKAIMLKMEIEDRNLMTEKQRRAKAAFYLEGIDPHASTALPNIQSKRET